MDFIKLDGSIMQGLHKDKESQEKIKNLSILAREKNIRTIAEQVQNANTMAVLWQLGVAYMQGNYVEVSDVVLEDTSTGLTAINLPAVDEDDAKKQGSA
jgi:EAL domain-containing protein (putative c-di-GMP-specific phosphodiesterase class I)